MTVSPATRATTLPTTPSWDQNDPRFNNNKKKKKKKNSARHPDNWILCTRRYNEVTLIKLPWASKRRRGMEEGARKETRPHTRRKGLSRVARWSNHPKTLSWNCLWALFYPRGTANCPPLQNSRRNFAAFRIKSAGLKPLPLSLSNSLAPDLDISLSLSLTESVR